jgi:cyclopropane-fatty-acyl-phospholipid synthase
VWTAWIGSTVNALSFRAFLDNSIAGSRANISAHYDLSNELFETFLDASTMAYSSGIFEATRTSDGNVVLGGSLAAAQERKLDHIIKRANIQPGHRVVDIGCGWGGLAIRIAMTVPDTVVNGISLSKEQLAWAQRRVNALGLQDRVILEHCDYRTFAAAHGGEFDRAVSVEMIEAVGLNHMGEYFACVDRLLAPRGVACIQAITIPESRFDEYAKSADFVNTIIFPGGALPSLAVLTDAMYRNSSLTVHRVENFAAHYAATLSAWYDNFNAVLPRVRSLGFDDAFIRMWNYYLKYCEGGFATSGLGLLVLVFTRPSNQALEM